MKIWRLILISNITMKTEVWGSKKTQLSAILSFRTVEGNTADEIHERERWKGKPLQQYHDRDVLQSIKLRRWAWWGLFQFSYMHSSESSIMLDLKIMRDFKSFHFPSSGGNTAGRILWACSNKSLTLGKQPAKDLWSFASHHREEIVKVEKGNKLCGLLKGKEHEQKKNPNPFY